MHTKARFNYIVIMLILAGLSSCTNFFTTIHTNTASNDIQRTQVNKTKENLVPVTFTFKDPYASRAIKADILAPDSYTFDFVCSTNPSDSFTQSLPVSAEYNFEMVIGNTYTLTIQGYNSTTLVCETSSSSTFTVQPGGTLDPSPSIQIRPAGTGNLSVSYSWADSTANITSVTASLIDSAGNPVTGVLSTDIVTTPKTVIISTSSPLPVGYYVLTIKFSDTGGVVLSYKESVTIKAGQTATSDKVTSGTTVNLGQSWFAVPPPEVQDAYYVVAPDGSFTVVWKDESESPGLSYEVRYDASISGLETQYIYSDLGSNVYAAKITGTVGTLDHVFVTATNAAGSNVGIEVNSTIIFTPMVRYEGNTYNTDYYFEQSATGMLLEPSITGTINDFPELITGSLTVITPAVTQYTVPMEVNINGLMTINTNFSDPSVNLDLYIVKILPQGQCYVDPSGDPTFSSGSNTHQFSTVQTAITRLNNAHVISNPYTINVDGTFSTNLIEINLSVLPPLIIDGISTATNISSNGDYQIFDISDATGILTIRNITLSNSTFSSGYGGAISKYGASQLNLQNVIVNNCSAINGGAIYIDAGNITLTGCTIENCSATSGGGMYVNGGSVSLTNCRIGRDIGLDLTEIDNYITTNNFPTAANFGNKAAAGGGIYINAGTVMLDNTYITYNYTGSGGGGGIYNNGTLTINSGFIAGNITDHTGGGGIYNTVSRIITQTGGFISFNRNTGYNGGGVRNLGTYNLSGGYVSYNINDVNSDTSRGGGIQVHSGSFNMTGGSIEYNTARNGGGVYLTSGNFSFTQGSISNNTAKSSSNSFPNAAGGAVYINGGTFTASETDLKIISNNSSVAETTIAEDTAFGGAIYAGGGVLTLKSCTIEDNAVSSPDLKEGPAMYLLISATLNNTSITDLVYIKSPNFISLDTFEPPSSLTLHTDNYDAYKAATLKQIITDLDPSFIGKLGVSNPAYYIDISGYIGEY